VGGFGSGRWPAYQTGKQTTDDYLALDIRELKRRGLVAHPLPDVPGVAPIEWAPAGFANPSALRPWFLCPKDGCQRRVTILYAPFPRRGDERTLPEEWACRTCRNLCYPVELEDRAERAARKMLKARAKLGPGPRKPKRMRHETFVRLGMEYLKARKEYGKAAREALLHQLAQMEAERIKFNL